MVGWEGCRGARGEAGKFWAVGSEEAGRGCVCEGLGPVQRPVLCLLGTRMQPSLPAPVQGAGTGGQEGVGEGE